MFETGLPVFYDGHNQQTFFSFLNVL